MTTTGERKERTAWSPAQCGLAGGQSELFLQALVGLNLLGPALCVCKNWMEQLPDQCCCHRSPQTMHGGHGGLSNL